MKEKINDYCFNITLKSKRQADGEGGVREGKGGERGGGEGESEKESKRKREREES